MVVLWICWLRGLGDSDSAVVDDLLDNQALQYSIELRRSQLDLCRRRYHLGQMV